MWVPRRLHRGEQVVGLWRCWTAVRTCGSSSRLTRMKRDIAAAVPGCERQGDSWRGTAHRWSRHGHVVRELCRCSKEAQQSLYFPVAWRRSCCGDVGHCGHGRGAALGSSPAAVLWCSSNARKQKRCLGACWVNATSHLLRWYEAGVQTAGDQLLVAAPSAAWHRRHGGTGWGGLERRRGCRVEGGQARDAGRRAGSQRSDAVGEAGTRLVLVRRRVADGEALGGAVAEP